jgi:predicted porin
MYNENGITVEYAPKNLLNDQLSFGASYISSRFGSAFNSNAIIQDNIQFNTTYLFSTSSLSPTIKLNAGYCFADYESSLFDEIDASMPLLSIEAGASYAFDFPLIAQAGLGYNLITSDGSSGIGTVYPLFVQCSFLWRFAL